MHVSELVSIDGVAALQTAIAEIEQDGDVPDVGITRASESRSEQE
jgi:hypothetical protein